MAVLAVAEVRIVILARLRYWTPGHIAEVELVARIARVAPAGIVLQAARLAATKPDQLRLQECWLVPRRASPGVPATRSLSQLS